MRKIILSIILLLMILSLLVSLIGCQETDIRSDPETTASSETESTIQEPGEPGTTAPTETMSATQAPSEDDPATKSPTEGETAQPHPSELTSLIPDQSYVGEWYIDEYREDRIVIYEVTPDSVEFDSGIFRLFGFTATAIKHDGEFFWGYDNSIYGGLKGRLKFDENSITVIYDSFGNFSDYNIQPTVYQFTIKDSNSSDKDKTK